VPAGGVRGVQEFPGELRLLPVHGQELGGGLEVRAGQAGIGMRTVCSGMGLVCTTCRRCGHVRRPAGDRVSGDSQFRYARWLLRYGPGRDAEPGSPDRAVGPGQ